MAAIVSEKRKRSKLITTFLTTNDGDPWGIICQGYDTPEEALQGAMYCFYINVGPCDAEDIPGMEGLYECEYWRWIPTLNSEFDVMLRKSKKGRGAFRAHVFDLCR